METIHPTISVSFSLEITSGEIYINHLFQCDQPWTRHSWASHNTSLNSTIIELVSLCCEKYLVGSCPEQSVRRPAACTEQSDRSWKLWLCGLVSRFSSALDRPTTYQHHMEGTMFEGHPSHRSIAGRNVCLALCSSSHQQLGKEKNWVSSLDWIGYHYQITVHNVTFRCQRFHNVSSHPMDLT